LAWQRTEEILTDFPGKILGRGKNGGTESKVSIGTKRGTDQNASPEG